MTTMERINRLTEERARLYRLATNGRRGDPAARERIDEITRTLDELWAQRRQERIGRREGIDRLVDRVYEEIYGERYEDTIKPPAVGEPEDLPVPVAA
jgi:hypothetical protein